MHAHKLVAALAFSTLLLLLPVSAQPINAPASAGTASLPPDLLNRILALIAQHGADAELSASMSEELGLASGSQGWSNRFIGAHDDEADSLSPLHNIFVSSDPNDDLVLVRRANGVSHFIRVHRDGAVVKEIVGDLSAELDQPVSVAIAQKEADAEFEFWDKNAEKTGYWWACAAELKGAHPADPQKKIAACTWIIQSVKESPAVVALAYLNRGWAHGREHWQQTLDDFRQATSLDPTNAMAWAQLCSVQNSADQDAEQAIQSCSKALELNPKSAEAWTFRGDVYLRNNQYKKAIADYDHAIAVGKPWMWPYDNRGEAYLRMNQIDRAIQDFNEVIEISPDYAMGYLDRGIAQMRRKDLDAAMADFQKGINLDPQCGGCYFGRGLVEYERGDAAVGAADLAKAKTLDSKVADDFALDGLSEP